MEIEARRELQRVDQEALGTARHAAGIFSKRHRIVGRRHQGGSEHVYVRRSRYRSYERVVDPVRPRAQSRLPEEDHRRVQRSHWIRRNNGGVAEQARVAGRLHQGSLAAVSGRTLDRQADIPAYKIK